MAVSLGTHPSGISSDLAVGERLTLVAFPGLASQAAWVSEPAWVSLLFLRYPLVPAASFLSAPLLQHHFAKP